MSERIIGHLDMDAFFASVEERDKPYLRGSPVIVGSDPQEGEGRGVVSTANYMARELGIHSALPIRTAWNLCEEFRRRSGKRCVFITSGFHRYGAASREVFAIVKECAPLISQTSIDEAYLDLSFCNSFKEAEVFAKKLKEKIKKETGLTCSIGIGNSKMIAKIASDYDKPDGLTVVYPRKVESFLAPLPISRIPGVGKKATQTFKRFGVVTVSDAQKYSWEELQRHFGKVGFSLWERVRGIDEREVETERTVRKSIGKHYTFGEDTRDMQEVFTKVQEQIDVILKSLKQADFNGFRTVVLTVRFDDFTTVTRSLTCESPLTKKRDLELKAMKLLMPFFEKTENPKNKLVRLIGLRVEKLE